MAALFVLSIGASTATAQSETLTDKAQIERDKGTSCPNSSPGDGPRRKMRDEDAAVRLVDRLKEIARFLRQELELDQCDQRLAGFEWNNNFGTDWCWIALYPSSVPDHRHAVQIGQHLEQEVEDRAVNFPRHELRRNTPKASRSCTPSLFLRPQDIKTPALRRATCIRYWSLPFR